MNSFFNLFYRSVSVRVHLNITWQFRGMQVADNDGTCPFWTLFHPKKYFCFCKKKIITFHLWGGYGTISPNEMTHGGGFGLKSVKKCHILFEWPLTHLFLRLRCVLRTDLSDSLPDSALFLLLAKPEAHETPLASLSLSDWPAVPDDILRDERLWKQKRILNKKRFIGNF